MPEWDDFLKLFAGLFSVVDPLGAIPFFISLTQNRSAAERAQSAMMCALAVGVVLMIALLGGEALLRLFGIGIPSFQVAGGILLLLMGIAMLRVSGDRSRQTPEEQAESSHKESIAVVPMAIPLLSGPGAISTVIVFAHADSSLGYQLVLAAVIACLAVTVFAALRMAGSIARALGTTGLNVVTRVVGLIIASVAVEFMAKGIGSLFPGLGYTG